MQGFLDRGLFQMLHLVSNKMLRGLPEKDSRQFLKDIQKFVWKPPHLPNQAI